LIRGGMVEMASLAELPLGSVILYPPIAFFSVIQNLIFVWGFR
jgi:hypothetical protein